MVLLGFQYTIHRSSEEKVSWQCVVRNCKGKAQSDDQQGTNADQRGTHNHEPNFGEAKATLAVSAMKRRGAEETHTPPSIITRDALAIVDSETRVAMPNEDVLKRTVRRVRRGNQEPLPRTLDDVEQLPERFHSVGGHNWLMHDSGQEAPHRIILFGLRTTIAMMSRSTIWLMDGTFKTTPTVVAQLYVIHYQTGDHVLPGIFQNGRLKFMRTVRHVARAEMN